MARSGTWPSDWKSWMGKEPPQASGLCDAHPSKCQEMNASSLTVSLGVRGTVLIDWA